MDNDESSVISKWVADMNQDLHKNNSDPSMELLWLPIKIDQNGNGEVIGEGGDTFSFHQLTNPSKSDGSSNTAQGEATFQTIEIPVSILDRAKLRNGVNNNSKDDAVLPVDNPMLIKVPADIRISVETEVKHDEDNVLQTTTELPPTDANNNNTCQPAVGSGTEQQRPAVEDQPAVRALDEVAVEAQDNNIMGPGVANWRVMLFVFIVCLIVYQLMDRLLMNSWSLGIFADPEVPVDTSLAMKELAAAGAGVETK